MSKGGAACKKSDSAFSRAFSSLASDALSFRSMMRLNLVSILKPFLLWKCEGQNPKTLPQAFNTVD
jgi:hypothetical protein